MKINVLVLVLVFSVIIALIGCGQNAGTTSSAGGAFFYANAQNTTPVFKPTATASSLHSKAVWGSGNPLYSVYFTLREFLSPRDEGIVDRSNLYKLLYDVDTVFSGISSEAVSITEEAVTSPFSAFGSITCDKVKNDATNKRAVAMKQSGDETNAILTWNWTTSATHEEYGIAKVSYNSLTKNLSIEMVFLVDYTGQPDYSLRCHVTGNTSANEFQFKYIIGNSSSNTRIIAKGVSKGAGNYMLFKYAEGGTDTFKYIVASAEADESFFISENTTPTNIYTDPALLPPTVTSYKDWVTAEAAFSSSDLLMDISTLNSGNSKAGTIYINY